MVRDTGGGKKTTTLTLRSPGKIQTKDSIRSGLGLGLVQVWSRFGPDLVQVSARFGAGPDQVLSRFGTGSVLGPVLDWSRSDPCRSRTDSGPIPVRSRSGPGLPVLFSSGPGPIQVRSRSDSGPVPVRSRSGSFIIRSGDKLINGSCRCSLIFT